ncbi:MAG TPA: hypothetical protein VJP86_12040 [Vicinamibacterales bacterium]|jgi:uncharacterized membrane protein YidH (DUF202 family)|nr:hypothetical protein [Vicinamibacterales bacterium]
MKLVGMLLIIFGIVALVIGGIRYTERDKVLDLGPIEATKEEHHTIPLPPVVGIVSVLGGIALVAAGSKARA